MKLNKLKNLIENSKSEYILITYGTDNLVNLGKWLNEKLSKETQSVWAGEETSFSEKMRI